MSKINVNILLVSLSNIGDVILTTPVLMNLRERFPDASFTFVCGPKAEGLIEGSSSIERLVIYDKKADLREKRRFLLKLRELRYDLVVDLRNTAIPFLVSAKKRSPLIRNYRETAMRNRHLEVLRMMGLDYRVDAPCFNFYSEEESLQARKKMSGHGFTGGAYMVMSPGSASMQKRWPLDFFRQLIDKLTDSVDIPIVLIGDQAESEYMRPIAGLWPGKVFNGAGILSLREAAAIIGDSELLVSNDSAAMHLGHELKRRVLALFGPTDPSRYGRRGPYFRLLSSELKSDNTVEWPSVEEAYTESMQLLQPNAV